MSFFKTDAGRALSKRPASKKDCTVRAVALVLGMSFDSAYEALAAAGRQPHKAFNFDGWMKATGKFVWVSFPAEKGKRRMTPEAFLGLYPAGAFILKTAKHVFAVIDGVVLDEQPNTGRCVYGAWKLMEMYQTKPRFPGASE